jgi:hypothetical protein
MNNLRLPLRILLLLVIFVLVVFGVWFLLSKLQKPGIKVDVSRDSVVKEIQSLNRLETASFSIEKIIEAGTDGNVFQEFLYGDRVLLIAHGKVIAGFDLSKLDTSTVKAEGSTLSLTLPAPQILSSTLDNEKTKVFDRKLGLLNKGDKDLESEARAAAEASITQGACEAGILDEATTSVREQLTKTFILLGFSTVEITIPEGGCP